MNPLLLSLGLAAIVFGVVGVLFPRMTWELFEAWKFKEPKNVEPSEAGFFLQRIGGLVLILLGFAVIYTSTW